MLLHKATALELTLVYFFYEQSNAMSRPHASKNDKEVNAVIFNMKEQRCLLKNLTTLDAEASYSLKLIDLNNRGIKMFYKRFKDKVNKIKSHLQSDEIAHLKILDATGEMRELVKPLNITGALRIADAEKRLKLQGRDYSRVSRSAMYRKCSDAVPMSPSLLMRPNTCVGNISRDSHPKRPRSLSTGRQSSISTPVMDKTPKDEDYNKSGNDVVKPEIIACNSPRIVNKTEISKNTSCFSRLSETPTLDKRHSKDHGDDELKCDINQSGIPRVIITPVPSGVALNLGQEDSQLGKTDSGSPTEKTSCKKVTIVEDFETFRKSAIEKRSRSRGSSITRMSATAAMKAGMFSCHTHSHEQLREMAKSVSSNGESVSNYIIDDPYQERRRELLDIEHSYANNLNERKEIFLDELDLYISKQNEEREPVKDSETDRPHESRLEKLTRAEMRRMQEDARRKSKADCRLRGDTIR